jgi:restriction system protein
MAIPDYQSVMLPLLRYAADEQEHSVREAIEALADQFRLTDEERKELLPSGGQATFDNRVGWARTYMKKAGLLESPRRSYFKITDRGLQALQANPEAINNRFLQQYPEFREFKTRSNTKAVDTEPGATAGATQDSEQTPREAMENAYDAIRAQLAGEPLEQIMSSSPRFFETLVVDLLVTWDTAARGGMPEKPWVVAATRGKTGSSRRTAWGWRWSKYRPSAGRIPCNARRSRSS